MLPQGPPAPDFAALHPGYALTSVIRRKALKLPFHRVDLRDIARDEVIAAALGGDHLKFAARVRGGGASAAEMDEGGEILLLLSGGLHIAGARENTSATCRSRYTDANSMA